MKEYYIYRITNNFNGKTYIGQRKYESDPDLDKYMGSGRLICKAYSKYGLEGFSKEIIRRYINSRSEADESERFYIYMERLAGHGEYNISDGGNGGNLGPQVNKLHSESLKKIYESPESRKVLSDRLNKYYATHTVSEETRLKRSKTISNKWKTDKQYIENQSRSRSLAKLGENNPMYGKTISEHTRDLLSQSHKRNWQNPEYRLKIISIHYGNTNVRGRIWINNGESCKMIKPDEVVPQGWVKGRIIKRYKS